MRKLIFRPFIPILFFISSLVFGLIGQLLYAQFPFLAFALGMNMLFLGMGGLFSAMTIYVD